MNNKTSKRPIRIETVKAVVNNPTATKPTWGFQFEILPMGDVELN
jgi:hypothetical protein